MFFLLLIIKLCFSQPTHYGFWFQYLPFSNIKKVGSLILNDHKPFTGQLVMANSNLVDGISHANLLVWLSFDFATVNITIYDNATITQLIQDPKNFEGVWHFLYCETLDAGSKLYIRGVSTSFLKISTQIVKPILYQYGEIEQYNFDYFHGNCSSVQYFQQNIFSSIDQFNIFVNSLNSPFTYEKKVIDIFDGIYLMGDTFYSTKMTLFGYKYQIRCWVKLNYQNVLERQRYLLLRLTLNQNYRNDSYLGDRLLLMSYILDPSADNYNLFNVSVLSYPYPYPQSYMTMTKNIFLVQNSSNRDRFQQWHFIYFQYLQSKTYLKLFYPDNQELSQTFDVLQFHNQYIYLYIGADTFFYKGYLQGKIWLELTFDYQEEEQYQIQCHYSCSICHGPTKMDCVACPENSNRELKNGYCSCLFGYIDLTQKCNKLNELHPNLREFTQQNIYKCQYGEFKTNNGCIPCPSQVTDYKLTCADCLLNSTTWQSKPICTFDYKRNFTNQTFFFNQRLESQKEIYYLHNQIQTIELCEGCLSYCVDDTKANCIQFYDNYYTCKKQYYKNGNTCKKCISFCKQCNDEISCLKCQKLYGYNGTACVKCPLNCQICDSITNCVQCQNGTSLFNGLCYQCGQLCSICEFYYDTLQKIYINRCLKCIDPSLYEISFDALKCQPVTYTKCKYGVQQFLGDITYTNIDLYFQPLKVNSSIISLCARCESTYTFSNYSNKCYSSTQVCGESSFYSQNAGFQCLIGVDTVSIQIIGCDQKLANCYQCLTYLNKVICIDCFNGYYGDHIVGTCTKCPNNCNSCGQQFKKNKSYWKKNIRAFYEYSVNRNLAHDYLTYVESTNPEDYEVICISCYDGYEIYNDTCILKCPNDCLECILIDGKNICSRCNYASNGLILSILTNSCYECHELCQFCVPNDEQQVTQFSNKCLKPAFNNTYFDPDIYQFSYCQDQDNCYQSLNLSLNIICDQGNKILNEDIIYNQEADLSTIFQQFYSDSLFNYMNTQNIQALNINVKLQSCIFPNNLAISQNFSQQVYTLKTVSLNFEGLDKNTTITLQGNFYIKQFSSLSLRNISISLPQKIIGMTFDINQVSILIEKVKFLSGISFYFSYQQLISFQIINTTFDSCHFTNVDSFIQVTPNFTKKVEIRQVYFQDVYIENSTFFKIANVQDLIISQVTFTDSILQNSTFFLINQGALLDNFFLSWNTINVSTFLSGINLELSYFHTNGNTFLCNSYFINTLNLQLYESILDDSYIAINSIFINVENQNNQVVDQINFRNVSVQNFMNYWKCYFIYIRCNCDVYLDNFTGILLFQEFETQIQPFKIESTTVLITNSLFNAFNQFSPIIIFQGQNSLQIQNTMLIQDEFITDLSFSQDCIQQSQPIQQALFSFFNVLEIIFDKFISKNIFSYNQAIIYITFTKNSENNKVVFKDSVFQNTLIIKTTNNVTVSFLSIESKNSIEIIMRNISFLNNICKEYFSVNTFGSSSTNIYLDIPQGVVSFINSIFEDNTILNSINSNIFISALSINFKNCAFKNHNYINPLFSQVLNFQSENMIYKEQFENYFSISSLGGVMQLQSEKIIINNTLFSGQQGFKGGCLYIVTLNKGIIKIIDSQFKDSQAILGLQESQGGAIYIDSKGAQLDLTIQNCSITNSQSYDNGGFLHLILSDITVVYFEQLIIKDCHSLLSSILSIEINGYLQKQYSLYINNCKIFNSRDGMYDFLNQISKQILSYGLSSEVLGSSLFNLEQGNIYITNSQIYNIEGYSLFILSNSGNITLKNLNIMEILGEQRSLIIFNRPQGKIVIIDCNFNNFQFNYKKQLCYYYDEAQITKNYCNSYENSIDYFSLHSYIKECIKNFSISVNYSNYNFITIVQAQDFIFINNIQTHNINCQGGAVIEIDSQFPVLVQNSKFVKLNSSLSVFNFTNIEKTRILFTYSDDLLNYSSQVTIKDVQFIKNIGINGSSVFSEGISLSLYNVIFQNNTAQRGGAIYSKNSRLELTNTQILSNNASFAGTIFNNNPFIIPNNRENLINGNYDGNNKGSIQSFPSKILISIDSVITFENKIITEQDNLRIEQVSQVIIVPNYVEIQNYKILEEEVVEHGQDNQLKYSTHTQTYISLNQKLRLIPINQYSQRQYNLQNTQCKITARLNNKNNTDFVEDYLSTNKVVFNTITQDYNLDNLRILTNESLQIKILCNAIKLPILDQNQQHIINYHNNYILLINITLLSCQKGEILMNNQCVECITQTYSLSTENTKCSIANQEVIETNTPANLKLKLYYWRPYAENDNIAYCFRVPEKCLGGWAAGPDSCIQGSFGALCETCDIYNIRGAGNYYESYLNCFLCSNSNFGYLSLLIVGTWTLVTMIISVNSSLETLKLELLRTKLIAGGLKAFTEHQESSSLYKMLFHYIQIISVLTTFQLEFPNLITIIINGVGSPTQSLENSIDCFLVNFKLDILHSRIIWIVLAPMIYLGIIFFSYAFLLISRQQRYKQSVTAIILCHTFLTMQPSMVGVLVSILGFRDISGIYWVSGDVSYRYDKNLYFSSIISLPLLSLLAIITPILLFYKLHAQRQNLNLVKQTWGYLYFEFHNKAYFWELVRLAVKNLVIISITLFGQYIIFKAVLVYLVLQIYQSLTKIYQPFKTSHLNKLDDLSSTILSISIVLGASSYEMLQTMMKNYIYIFYVIILELNATFLFKLFSKIISEYKRKNKNKIEKFKGIIIEKFPVFTKLPLCRQIFFATNNKQIQIKFRRVTRMLKESIQIQKRKQNFVDIPQEESIVQLHSPDYNILKLKDIKGGINCSGSIMLLTDQCCKDTKIQSRIQTDRQLFQKSMGAYNI